jgi:diguanylate cyclase (GGDEF)-like protein/PAS domain S-box-containing protein
MTLSRERANSMLNMKYFIAFAVLLFMALGYQTYEQYQRISSTQKLIIKNESESLANFISAFRQTYQSAFIDNHIEMDPKMINLLPVKTISEISSRFAVIEKEDIVIRTVSDRPRNPKNKANTYEMHMIDYFRNNPKVTSKFLEKDDAFYYTKPMRIKESCLKCHGKREDAILSIRNKYTSAYDYKLGEVRGLLNIKIKEKGFFDLLYADFIDTLIITMLLYIVFLTIIYILIRKIRTKEQLYTQNLEVEIKEKTSEIQKQKETFETLFEKSSNGIFIIYNGKFIQCNEKAVALLECNSKDDILAKDVYTFSPEFQIDKRHSSEKIMQIINDINETNWSQFEWLSQKMTGEIFWTEVSMTPIMLNNKKVIYTIARDISEKKTAQKILVEQKDSLYHQAHHDVLTGLPNRTLFHERLGIGIEKAKHNDSQLALFFIDLDQFKQINDSLGHDIGDRVLKVAAERLKAKIRKKDTLARLGGDEFVLIIENYKNAEMISKMAEVILKVLTQPIHIEGHTLYTSCSIGISLYPKDDLLAENLLKYADAAMYNAKDEGRNNYQFYRAEMTELALKRIMMRSGLGQALENGEFLVYYQPQIDASNGNLIGMEALLRWRHPNMGLILPEKFIALAEESGLIVEIDRWVMKTAMLQVNHWYGKGMDPGVLALNLSLVNLNRDDYMEMIGEMFEEIYFRSEWLELEITENEVMKKFEEVLIKLKLIHNMGISIAIDDFGTGQSSLSYLKRLPVNKLKIDKSFIDDIPQNREDSAIVKAIIELAKNLNLDILAEGVETAAQKDFLLQNACKKIQGFYYAHPMTALEIEDKYFSKNTS